MNELAIKVFVIALILSVTMFGGCRWQAKLDAGAIVEAKAETAKAKDALRIAANALRADAGRFRDIDEANAANIAIAEGQREAALKSAQQAEADKLAFASQISRLQTQAAKDKKTCTIEEARICGSPLR